MAVDRCTEAVGVAARIEGLEGIENSGDRVLVAGTVGVSLL